MNIDIENMTLNEQIECLYKYALEVDQTQENFQLILKHIKLLIKVSFNNKFNNILFNYTMTIWNTLVNNHHIKYLTFQQKNNLELSKYISLNLKKLKELALQAQKNNQVDKINELFYLFIMLMELDKKREFWIAQEWEKSDLDARHVPVIKEEDYKERCQKLEIDINERIRILEGQISQNSR